MDDSPVVLKASGYPLLATRRLADLDAGRYNNLNLLRFVAASLVVFSHSFPLSGHLHEEPLARATRILDFASLAVIVFFAISGYLVARSFDRSAGLLAFTRARALRIVPAYVLAVFYTALILGPLVTTLPLAEYLADARTWRYVGQTLLLGGNDRLPGVFVANPFPGGVNGSLWTMPVEVFCYFGLALAGLLGALRRPWLALAIASTLIAAAELWPAFVAALPKSEAMLAPRFAGTFIAGVLAYVFRRHVPVSPLLAIAALIAALALLDTPVEVYVLFGALAYVSLTLGLHPSLDVPGFRRVGDYSYGIYVFAFPTQQAVAWVTGPVSPWVLFGLAYPIVLALAVASWHAIEAPALRLKKRRALPDTAISARPS